jgi:hypothetical protein
MSNSILALFHRLMRVLNLTAAPPDRPPNQSYLAFTQCKAPYTSSECKILNIASKTLAFAVNLAVWALLWGPARILHPLWQGKGAFLNLHRWISASGYVHYKCCITMLQCQIWGRGTGNAGEWEALTQETGGKKTGKQCRMSLLTCLKSQPGFLL